MKKLLSLVIVMTLCASAAAYAETTISAREIEAYSLELNPRANTLIVTDRSTGKKYIADTEMNQLSDEYNYINDSEDYYKVANEDLKVGLLDGNGNAVMPEEYGEIELISDRWFAGIRLVETEDTEENPDYRAFFGGGRYMIDTVDVYYAREKKGTLSRAEWQRATAYGDYLCIRDREEKYTFYNKNFEKSDAEVKYAEEYDNDYSTKTITHLGSNQPAFTAGCTLAPEEVEQYIWISREDRILDLQGNETGDLSAYRSAYVDQDSNLIKIQNEEGKYGVADSTGKEIVPCLYDSISYALDSALRTGYLYAERDGKSGFVNLETGTETGFEFIKDAGTQRANFIIVDDSREGKILISAVAGELAERFREVSANFQGNGDECRYAVVKGQDDTCRIIGQLGEDILPGVTFKSLYDAKMSDDGTLILLPGAERGTYVLYTVSYDPDLSAIPAAKDSDDDGTWTCENGHTGLTGNFCPECGAKRPEE